MANERDTDRLAGELLGALMGSLNKPLTGPGPASFRPQLDQNTMLNTIKDFLNQTLSGSKEQEQPRPAAPQMGSTVSQQSVGTEATGWEGLFRRQGQEREAMHSRHERERQEMHSRHEQEMQAAMSSQSARPAGPYQQAMARDAQQWGQARAEAAQRRRGPGDLT